MSHVRLAAALFAAYGLLLLANGVLYFSWSGDTSEFPRLFVRVAGVVLIALGLWRSARWAWWFGVFAGAFLGAIGLVSLGLAASTSLFADRPYPIVDYAVITASAAALLSAFILLLLPQSRAAFRRAA